MIIMVVIRLYLAVFKNSDIMWFNSERVFEPGDVQVDKLLFQFARKLLKSDLICHISESKGDSNVASTKAEELFKSDFISHIV